MSQLDIFSVPPMDADIGAVDQWATDEGLNSIMGVDEAGRGPLAGPVVAAAVVLPPLPLARSLIELNDSKKLSQGQRDRLFDEVHRDALAVGVGLVDAPGIDKHNILEATRMAMRQAVAEASITLGQSPEVLFVDGNLPLPKYSGQQWPLVKGDGRCWAIAAASVIAKVTRDRIMLQLHEEYPMYGFDQHKGYGTVAHRRALAQHGSSSVHRRSFKWSPPK